MQSKRIESRIIYPFINRNGRTDLEDVKGTKNKAEPCSSFYKKVGEDRFRMMMHLTNNSKTKGNPIIPIELHANSSKDVIIEGKLVNSQLMQ